ncbi:MAG TPA: MarR family transcriptional regulator [Steroidobacteraceae bacterium]|nr:MarR family transcriptional regulator [Steroidobacteraceae bacterium]
MTNLELPLSAIPLPALLRHARTAYGSAMRGALEEGGYGDIPKNGLYVIGGLALGTAGDIPLAVLIRDLRISKQAAGQLVDALVSRGYLARTVDEQDRRRLVVTLTDRGRAAAATQAAARERVDAALLAKVGQQCVEHTRVALAALAEMAGWGEPAATEEA